MDEIEEPVKPPTSAALDLDKLTLELLMNKTTYSPFYILNADPLGRRL